MKNSELIENILVLSDQYSESALKSLNKEVLKEIYIDLMILNEDGLDVAVEDIIDEDNESIVINVNISSLSKHDQRLYSKTGKIPQKIIDRILNN